MIQFDARVVIALKPGVLDPQGKASADALGGLGFSGVQSVRQGKVMDIELQAADIHAARSDLEAMCDRLLANTVIEDFEIAMLSERVEA